MYASLEVKKIKLRDSDTNGTGVRITNNRKLFKNCE